jgi:ribose transport system permease protein
VKQNETPMTSEDGQSNFGSKWKRFSKASSSQISMFLAVAVIFIVVSVSSKYFLTSANLSNLGVAMSTYGLLGAGLTVCMLLGGLDLAQMSVMAIGGMVIGLMVNSGISIWWAMLMAPILGIACGVVNGLIITKMKIIPMIATIGTMMSFRAVAYLMTNGSKMKINDPVLDFIGFGHVLGIPVMLWVMLVAYVVVFFFLKYTVTGRSVYAIGSNATAAYLSGIKSNKVKMISYIISGFSAGIASILFTSQMRTSVPAAGSGNEFIPIAAVIMGGVGLGGGKGNIVGTFLGVALLAIFSNAMILLNIQVFYQQLLNGVILILAVFIDTVRSGGYKL